jgi:hypothetical protein
MPYKRKEDRTEAVRRHRERKKEEEDRREALRRYQQKQKDIIRIAPDDIELGEFLIQYLDFVAVPFVDFVVWIQGLKIEEDGTWFHDDFGEKVYPPKKIYLRGNMTIYNEYHL